jgi:hypothetical protein
MRLARILVVAASSLGLSTLAACSSLLGDFQLGSDSPDAGQDGAVPGVDAGASDSGAILDAEAGPSDAGRPTEAGNDAAVAPDGCSTATCSDPSTLTACDGTSQTCTFGCLATGGAHCAALYPTAPVSNGDLTVAGVLDVTISQSTEFFTDTGAIENVRAANSNPAVVEVNSGIAFHVATQGAQSVAVWSFKSLSIPTGVVVRFNANNPAALVAASTMTVVGVIDARGYDANGTLCGGASPGPGGGAGGATSGVLTGQGLGGGLGPNPNNTYSGGPSGGSFGGVGGAGGYGANQATQPGAAAGAIYGTPALSPLLGGSGGGGAGAVGGGGGGAIQLVAGQQITMGGGTNPGGVNAGGCNGHGASYGSAGSGGGSGGGILVETPSLQLQANGVLAANGGAGAAGDSTPDPLPGQMSAAYVPGAIPSGGSGYGAGGGPGVGASPAGVQGSHAVNSNGGGGAGGGGAGRIRINNLSGSFTPGSGAIITPSLGITPDPVATVGSLDLH